jgi:hypothetical protein
MHITYINFTCVRAEAEERNSERGLNIWCGLYNPNNPNNSNKPYNLNNTNKRSGEGGLGYNKRTGLVLIGLGCREQWIIIERTGM